jgi:hypothetical protein
VSACRPFRLILYGERPERYRFRRPVWWRMAFPLSCCPSDSSGSEALGECLTRNGQSFLCSPVRQHLLESTSMISARMLFFRRSSRTLPMCFEHTLYG